MRKVTVRQLSPEQVEDWEFRLEPLPEGGGIVSVPAAMRGQPIDWPPRSAQQLRWLESLAPQMQARAGAAWYLEPRSWKRLVETLDAQAALEEAS